MKNYLCTGFFIALLLITNTLNAQYGAQFHNSVLLNGSNDVINCGNLNTMPNQGTISYWLNFGRKTGIMGTFASSFGGNNAIRFEICEPCPDGTFGVVIGNDGGGLQFAVYLKNTEITVGQWYHITLTWDKPANNIKGYVNGVEKFNQSQTFWPTTDFNNMLIGVGYSDDRKFFGRMDELRIWNTAHTQSQIIANMNSEIVGNKAMGGMLGYWDMNISGQGSGLTVPNRVISTGTAIDGHTVGTATSPVFSTDPVLAVELMGFQARFKNPSVLLNWQTASEKNMFHFEVERSSNGKLFEKIGAIKAVNKVKTYEFTDEHPLSILTYYRLKQVDLDGQFTYSKTVSVDFNKDKTLKIYPNPSQNDFTIDLPTSEKEVVIEVFDVTGKAIFSKNTEGVSIFKLEANSWLSGIYILKISNNQTIWTEKIMKF